MTPETRDNSQQKDRRVRGLEGDDIEENLRRELARYSRRLGRLGFTPGTSGNLSARLGADRLLVTPTGVSKAMVRPADIVVADMDGCLCRGTRRITSEIGMHLAIYRARPDVLAVLHAHPPIATAFACSGRALDECLCQEAVMTVGTVPLARYATTGTAEVADSLSPWIAHHDAILLENHGVVTAGRCASPLPDGSMDAGAALLDAFFKLEILEHIAQVSLIAHQLGTPRPLHSQQIQQLHQAKSRYLQNMESRPARTSNGESTPVPAVSAA